MAGSQMRLVFDGQMVLIGSWWRGWILGEGIERAISTTEWFLTGQKPKYLRAWREPLQ